MKAISSSAVILLALTLVGCNAAGGGAASVAVPETVEQRASYAIGYGAGEQLGAQGGDIDVDQLVAGLRDAFGGTESKITDEDMQTAMMEFQQAMMAAENERMAEEAATNKAEGDAYLEENAARAGVMVTDSGLQYEILEESTGASPLATDEVTLHYSGSLIDGTVFDSSYDRGQPATLTTNRFIPGFSEGLQLMSIGSKYRFVIPGEIGYGMSPPPGEIGPNDTLVFEVELLAINGQS